MDIASTLVVGFLFSCFYFFISLPFGVQRDTEQGQDFSDIRQAYLGRKLVIAIILGTISAGVYYLLEGMGMLDIFVGGYR